MSDHYKKMLPIYDESMKKIRGRHDNHLYKIMKMQEIYLSHNQDYSKESIENIRSQFATIFYKSLLRSMHLEQIWSIRDYNVDEIVLHIDVLPSEVTWNETQFIVGNMYLESYLFQARSFIDIYMRYICTIFELGKLGHLSRKKFKKRLRNTPAKYTKKAENITEDFDFLWFLSAIVLLYAFEVKTSSNQPTSPV